MDHKVPFLVYRPFHCGREEGMYATKTYILKFIIPLLGHSMLPSCTIPIQWNKIKE